MCFFCRKICKNTCNTFNMWYNKHMTTANKTKVLPEMYESLNIDRTQRFARMTELIQQDLCEKGIAHRVVKSQIKTQFDYAAPSSKYRETVPTT